MVLARIGSLRGWRRSPRPRLLALVALAAALVLAGCGGTPASSSAPAPGVDVKPSAAALQEQFVQVVKQVGPSVVLIQTSEGLGSGVVFDAKGDVVTNNHVVDNADGFQVTLANGRRYPAQPVGTFPADDLAVRPARRSRSRSATPAELGGRCGSPSASSRAETTEENR